MSEQEHTGPIIVYNSIVHSFMLGMVRLMSSQAASGRLSLALHQFHHAGKHDISDSPYCDMFQNLSKIPYSSYDAFQYMENFTYLVYATTLLDTFLNDSTMFLLILFPKAIGKSQQITVTKLLTSSSKNEILTEAALKRAREISYSSFKGRIEYLNDTFGLDIKIDQDSERSLEHYPSVRNLAVHDQGVFEIYLGEDSQIHCRQKTCPLHPTIIEWDDLRKATHTYSRIAASVIKAIIEKVIKTTGDPTVGKMMKIVGDIEKGSLSLGVTKELDKSVDA